MRRSAQIQPIVHRVWRESSSACGFKRDSPNFDRPMTAVLKLSATLRMRLRREHVFCEAVSVCLSVRIFACTACHVMSCDVL